MVKHSRAKTKGQHFKLDEVGLISPPDIRYTALAIYKKVTLASKDENLRY